MGGRRSMEVIVSMCGGVERMFKKMKVQWMM